MGLGFELNRVRVPCGAKQSLETNQTLGSLGATRRFAAGDTDGARLHLLAAGNTDLQSGHGITPFSRNISPTLPAGQKSTRDTIEMPPRVIRDRRNAGIDVLRGTAILMVMLLHFSLTYRLWDSGFLKTPFGHD